MGMLENPANTRCCRFAVGVAVLLTVQSAIGATVTGIVLDAGTRAPIGGATVTLQATSMNTTTAADGTFILDVPTTAGIVLVAARKGYFNLGKTIDAPATGVEFQLDPVWQDDDPTYEFLSPKDCGLCHPNQLGEWMRSRMSMAGSNTWVSDIFAGDGTPGGMGGFVYQRDSVWADTNPSSECASCHQPERWIKNPFTALASPDPWPLPEVSHGVSCDVCHKIANVDTTKINFPGIFPGAVTYTRPANPGHQVEYGVLPDVDFSTNSDWWPIGMRGSYNPQLVAETCAACHQDANDPGADHSYTGVVSEPTYLEWVATPYADATSPTYASCVDCHMPPSGHTRICEARYPPLERDPNTVRSHTIEGTTPQFLENAVEMAMSVDRVGDSVEIQVDITNSLTGHHVPTGVTIRNMVLVVDAKRQEDSRAFEYIGTQTVHDLGGIGDPAQGYYASLPGKLFAKVNHNGQGQGPTFFTDATGIQFDNRIPALATDSTHYSFRLPGGGGVAEITARLIYRRSFRFLTDAKQWTRDGHGNPLEDVAPPYFGHLMEQSVATVSFARFDSDGDGDVDLCDYGQLAECYTGPNAGPPAAGCSVLDDDNDGDVDLRDFAGFQTTFGH